tara:strand:- start:527 stop:673 length:147 start_codon:yes stop_codon:yes gene_type:complete
LSFGGGSAGSTGVSAHDHSNSVGMGGTLSTTSTLIADSNLYTRILVGV